MVNKDIVGVAARGVFIVKWPRIGDSDRYKSGVAERSITLVAWTLGVESIGVEGKGVPKPLQ